LPLALKLIFKTRDDGNGDVSSFAALCTALAATVGTGSVVGVATAITVGGPGALLWMILTAFIGMSTKYAESLLAVKFRQRDAKNQISGGPMYFIINGMGKKYKFLAVIFAIFGVLAALFGIGTFTQVNSIVSAIENVTQINPWVINVVVTMFATAVIIGGIRRISKVAENIIPFITLLYIAVCIAALIIFRRNLMSAVSLVINGAFTGTAATGGFLGSAVTEAIKKGVSRGIFSNESGLGSEPIAAAAARTYWPAEQGLISMTCTFIDTIIICSLSGLTMIVTGAWCSGAEGAAMTQLAFERVLPDIGAVFLAVALALFAFLSIIGWNYYGERCCEYLFGVRSIVIYRILYILLIGITPLLRLNDILAIADILNAFMVVPNLIAVLSLSKIVISETKKYFDERKKY
jgi:AGCS family alanine or glycine:cation symporter